MKWFFRIGLLLSAAAILAIDYPWGDFTGHTHWLNVRWVPFVSPPIESGDVLQNILMALPLGFFAAAQAGSAGKGVRAAVLVALPVSVAGEWTQLYSHGRFPSSTDVTANVIGAVFGALWACWIGLAPKG